MANKWKGLGSKAGYVNPYDVWNKHPDRPALLDTTSSAPWSKGDTNWSVTPPRTDETSKRQEKGFRTFVDAKAWAAKHLGIKGWTYVSVNRMGVWLPDDDSPDAAACEVRVHGSGPGSYSHRCGRPAVGEVTDWGKLVPACNTHVRQQERRAERSRQWREEWDAKTRENEERERQRQVAEEQAERLRAKGFHATVGKSAEGRWDVLLNGEVALALVDRFELLCREVDIPFDEEVADITKGGRV